MLLEQMVEEIADRIVEQRKIANDAPARFAPLQCSYIFQSHCPNQRVGETIVTRSR
jgi:hypothetical protein